jgi:hypothetical protein
MKSTISNLLLLTTVTACVPILGDRSSRIPMYPGETWNLQIFDTQSKEIVNRNYVLQGQSLSYDSLKIQPNSGVVVIPGVRLANFQSGKIEFKFLNAMASGEVAEIKSGNIVGVIHYVNRDNGTFDTTIYSDNSLSVDQQIACFIKVPRGESLSFENKFYNGSCKFSRVESASK